MSCYVTALNYDYAFLFILYFRFRNSEKVSTQPTTLERVTPKYAIEKVVKSPEKG
jgi:hypothetical protein